MRKTKAATTGGVPLRFQDAFYDARTAARLDQAQLGARLGVSARTLVRWEGGQVMPREYVRGAIVSWLATVPRTYAEPVLRTLGMLQSDVPVGAVSADEDERTRVVLEHAVLSAAEANDVSPRVLRTAVIAVLEATRLARVPVATAVAVLTAASARSGAVSAK